MFFWLTLLGRCWTSECLHRHGLSNHGPCVLCSQADKMIEHLLLHYVVSREIWFKVLRRFSWHSVAPEPFLDMDVVTWWLRSRKQIEKGQRKVFNSLVVLVAWQIWLQCNTQVFRGDTRSPVGMVDDILSCFDLWCRAGLVNRSCLAHA
jgi:hypothetical protein